MGGKCKWNTGGCKAGPLLVTVLAAVSVRDERHSDCKTIHT